MINETPCARCPTCDYDLRGRPEPGPCPECGTVCDDDTLVLYGRRADSGSGDAAVALAAIAGILACMGLAWVALAVAATFVILLVVIVVRRQRFGRRGTMHQLLLRPEGISIREGPGPAKFTPWKRFGRMYMRRGIPSLAARWRRRGWRLRVSPRFGSYGSTIQFTFEAPDEIADMLRARLDARLGKRYGWGWRTDRPERGPDHADG